MTDCTACTATSKPDAPTSSDISVLSCLIQLNLIGCLHLSTPDPVSKLGKAAKSLCGPSKGWSWPLSDLSKALSP